MPRKADKSDTSTRARDWKPRFIEAFRNSGNVRAACQAAGISRSYAYQIRNEDEQFAADWDQAREDAIDTLEATAWQRARNGQSDYLLWKMLQANRRALYGDKQQVDVTITREDRIDAVMREVRCERPEAEELIAEAERILANARSG